MVKTNWFMGLVLLHKPFLQILQNSNCFRETRIIWRLFKEWRTKLSWIKFKTLCLQQNHQNLHLFTTSKMFTVHNLSIEPYFKVWTRAARFIVSQCRRKTTSKCYHGTKTINKKCTKWSCYSFYFNGCVKKDKTFILLQNFRDNNGERWENSKRTGGEK